MSEEERPTERVDALLEDLRTALADADEDAGSSDESDPLPELADRAEEIVATSQTPELLAAVGLPSDDKSPSGVVRAVAEGDADAVEKLHALLELAKYDEEEPDALERLRDAAGLTEAETEGGEKSGDAAAEETDDPSDSGLARMLLDALAGTFDSDEGDETGGEERDDGETSDEERDDDETSDEERDDDETDDAEAEEPEEESEDDGLVETVTDAVAGDEDDSDEEDVDEPDESDESAEEEKRSPKKGKRSGNGTRHSTVPRSKRSDFSVPARHSTMPKRDR